MNEHTRLAIASGIFAGTALAAIAVGWFVNASAAPAKPAYVPPVFDQRRFNESVTAAEQSRRLQQMTPCTVACPPPTPEQREMWKRERAAYERRFKEHEETLKRLKARPLDPTGNRVAPRPRWEWKQT